MFGFLSATIACLLLVQASRSTTMTFSDAIYSRMHCNAECGTDKAIKKGENDTGIFTIYHGSTDIMQKGIQGASCVHFLSFVLFNAGFSITAKRLNFGAQVPFNLWGITKLIIVLLTITTVHFFLVLVRCYLQ